MIKEDIQIKELMYDVIFKAVFTRETDVLLKIIKSLLDIEDTKDKPITIVGYELPPFKKDSKTNKSDMLIKLSDNSYVNIEVNREKQGDIISRNIIQMSRIYASINKAGEKNSDITNKIVRGINLNDFSTFTGKPIEQIALCETKSGKIISYLLSFCNVDVALCSKMVYNVDKKKIDESVRWGAILTERSLAKISEIIGGDLLSMEEKESFINTVKEVNEDERVLADWMWEDNERRRKYDALNTAKQDGIKEGTENKAKEIIISMLKKNTDHSFISEVTGKSLKEIQKIAKEYNII